MPNTLISQDPVLIVGGGPTGLVMAIELARRHIPYRVIDIARSATDKSKAIGIQARTLESFENIGIVNQFTFAGKKTVAANIYHDSHQLAHVTFGELDSDYPYVLMLPQSQTESILIDHLESLGGAVERGVELKTFVQDSDGISATLTHADGEVESVRTPWLIGCDGAHSIVRHQLALPFIGEEYAEGFQLADVKIVWPLDENEVHIFVHSGWLLAAFPLPNGRYRLIADVSPEDAPLETAPTLEHWQKLMDDRVPMRASLSDPRWTANYRIHRRLTTQLRSGRAFLVGDAAHIHSPAGAQGMNTGIQDAINLAWKLALVSQSIAKDSLLDSYHAERYPVEKALQVATDLPLRLFGITNPIAQAVRDRIMPLLAGLGLIQQKARGMLSELAVQYIKSPIVEEHALGAGPKAGERAPNGVLRSAPEDSIKLYNLLSGAGHKLLVFEPTHAGSELPTEVHAVTDIVHERLNNNIPIFFITPILEDNAADGYFADTDGSLTTRYGASRGAVYLVRPDGYIAFRSPLQGAAGKLSKFLDKWLQ